MRYDPFQLQSIRAIDEEKSVLVSAPTGAGKTAIAEYAIDKALSRSERVIYTAPIKALSNQKFRDFSAKYGTERVGLLTGDVSLNAGAPVVIMTTEIYRNQLFEDPERLRNTSWVIFDEVHYLDDLERGTVWEEAIMFSPEHVRLLALSATAPNVEEVAAWIRGILRHPIEVVIETHRPVPLVHLFQCQGRLYDDTRLLRKEGYLNMDVWPSFHGGHHRGRERFSRRGRHQMLRARPNRAEDLVAHVKDAGRLPCLYFAFGRKRAEMLAREQQRFDFLTAQERASALERYDALCARYELTAEPSAADMRSLVGRGIAFHHAGMLPTLKEVIEQLFTSKLIKLICTTETFALGINMPARSVIFDETRKFYGTHFGTLRTRDFYQMAGRAGRRGMDAEGYVYTRVNPHDISHSALLRVISGRPEPIESQFNSCYATILNLYAQFGSKLSRVYPRSFHYFQSNKRGREKGLEAIENKLSLLGELGFFDGEKLSVKGEFASWMYGYELLLSEWLQDGSLETLDDRRLAVLLSALVFEPRKNQLEHDLPGHLAAMRKRALATLRKIHYRESVHRIRPLTKVPEFHLARVVEAWMSGAPFHSLGKYTDTDEGEIIRYFRMVIQLLRQLRQAPQVSPRLRATAGSAVEKINRDFVDAERQLRTA